MIANRVNNTLKDDHAEQRLFAGRAKFGFAVVVLCMLMLLSRYVWLQYTAHDKFSARSENNRVKVRPVVPNRGLIYDRRGRVIAENRPAYRLEIVPEKAGDINKLLQGLSKFIDISDDDIKNFEKARRQYRVFDSVPVKFNLSEKEVARFAVNRHRFPGAEVVPYLSRYYPYGELLTHVLGYVGRMDERDMSRVDAGNYRGTYSIGKTGVEQYREKALHGISGFERVETNARGRVLKVIERQDAVVGDDLILSIDVAVQQAAWDALGDRAGAVVAIDPRDGSIIAMVSKPAYDPNAFVRGIAHKAYQAILKSPYRPLFNRAIRGGYEPGSTLKPFVGLAGLELGLLTPKTRIFSNGTFYLEGYSRPFHDWKEHGHGWVNIVTALEQSVNTYFYTVAMDLGIDRMHDYLAQFGFGATTGVDLPGEGNGVLPSRQWKLANFNKPWYPGETVIAGIGQGYNVVTPLQLANAVATLVNGGTRYKPRLLYAVKHPGDARAVRVKAPVAETVPVNDRRDWQAIYDGMEQVVNGLHGTARGIADGAKYKMGGKTGTAQVYTQDEDEKEKKGKVAEKLRDHALFVAFAPVKSPRIAIAVVVDHGGSGPKEAAPIARATLDAWLNQGIGTGARP